MKKEIVGNIEDRVHVLRTIDTKRGLIIFYHAVYRIKGKGLGNHSEEYSFAVKSKAMEKNPSCQRFYKLWNQIEASDQTKYWTKHFKKAKN